MENETMQALMGFAENLSVIGVLLMAWIFERRRGDRLELKLITSYELHEAKHD